MSLNDYSYASESPTFYEVLQAAQDSGLVGEENTVLTLILAMVRGHLVVVTGVSRAGKDVTVDAAESTFPAEELVYKWPVDDSETAAYYKREEISQYDVHRFPDLARLPEHQEKILKAFGEGRDAERNRTDITREEGDQVEDQVIDAPNTVIAFIASDNENINLDEYPELRNRALTISVDATEAQTKRVNRRKAEERAGVTTNNIEPLRRVEIQNYHASIPTDEWVDTHNEILNPAAVEIHSQEPIPEIYPEARQDFDRLLEFMETVALYHYTQRLVIDDRMFVAPTDIWQAMTILGNKMVMSALNLQHQDRAVLQLLKESKTNLTKAEIQQDLRTHGFNITDKDVMRSLDSMRTKAYVRVHQGDPNEYTVNEFASVTDHDSGLDYSAIVDAAAENIYDLVPNDKADLYASTFCEGNGLMTTHPITGQAVNIEEQDPLEEMVGDALVDMDGVLAYDETSDSEGEDEDEEEEAAVGKTQGTLT